MSLVVELDLEISAARAEVWWCLTEARHRDRWWREGVVLEPVPGGRFEEPWRPPGGAERLTRGRVLAIAPPRRLVLSWADDDWPVETRVTFVLESKGTGTHLKLKHDGWSAFPDETAPRLCQAHDAGWRDHLEALKTYVETR